YGPGDYGRRIRFQRRTRFYKIHVPADYKNNVSTPVVLVFHGGGGDPETIRYTSGMDQVADRENFIVVYPAGTNSRLFLKDRLLLWNDGRQYQNGSYSKVDDMGFVVTLLDDLAELFNVDRKRIYACGYSNGAQFTYRLAKRLSGKIAAVAMVAGQRPVKDDFDPLPTRPISIMQFSGLQDMVAPYSGGSGPKESKIIAVSPSVRKAIKSWVAFNECPEEPIEVKRVGKALMNRYGPGHNRTEVILWTLEDGGHTWPGGKVVPSARILGLDEKIGNVNRDINASDLMWEFFKSHPK
ncbi:MAG: hypothetical protein HQ572_03880, partial [Candidatus Omnitrophica bacterium]|nr:hypothetical protein [Candidatus Omnitrophota bacterium]